MTAILLSDEAAGDCMFLGIDLNFLKKFYYYVLCGFMKFILITHLTQVILFFLSLREGKKPHFKKRCLFKACICLAFGERAPIDTTTSPCTSKINTRANLTKVSQNQHILLQRQRAKTSFKIVQIPTSC